jgi:hypothetical protein
MMKFNQRDLSMEWDLVGSKKVLSSRKEDGDAHDAVFEVLNLADRICSW